MTLLSLRVLLLQVAAAAAVVFQAKQEMHIFLWSGGVNVSRDTKSCILYHLSAVATTPKVPL